MNRQREISNRIEEVKRKIIEEQRIIEQKKKVILYNRMENTYLFIHRIRPVKKLIMSSKKFKCGKMRQWKLFDCGRIKRKR